MPRYTFKKNLQKNVSKIIRFWPKMTGTVHILTKVLMEKNFWKWSQGPILMRNKQEKIKVLKKI